MNSPWRGETATGRSGPIPRFPIAASEIQLQRELQLPHVDTGLGAGDAAEGTAVYRSYGTGWHVRVQAVAWIAEVRMTGSVRWLGGWDKGKVFYMVMVERRRQ